MTQQPLRPATVVEANQQRLLVKNLLGLALLVLCGAGLVTLAYLTDWRLGTAALLAAGGVWGYVLATSEA